MSRNIALSVAVMLLLGCGNPDPNTISSGITVAITQITMNDGPNENNNALEVDAVQNPSCPTTGDPEEFTNAYINLTFRANYVVPDGTTVQQDYNWVHLRGYTITYTPKDPNTTAEIPSVTRAVQQDIEIGAQPEIQFMFMTIDQKIAWATTDQAAFPDTLPKEYEVRIEFDAVDPRGNPVTIIAEKTVSIGDFDNC